MPRNQSEKGPVVWQRKKVTPMTWSRACDVRLLEMPDGTWETTTCGNEFDLNVVGHKAVGTFEEALEIYDAIVPDFRFHNVPGPSWVNTYDGP